MVDCSAEKAAACSINYFEALAVQVVGQVLSAKSRIFWTHCDMNVPFKLSVAANLATAYGDE
jgi:hypothetical protein